MQMRYMGNLTREIDDEDMDNIPVNSIYLISSSAGETTLLNFPDYNGSGILITAGMEGAFTYQMLIGNIPNSYYLRFRYGSGTWADWRKVIDGSAISDDSRGTNPIREASDAVLLKFERPADQSTFVQEKRASYGEEFFKGCVGCGTSETGRE